MGDFARYLNHESRYFWTPVTMCALPDSNCSVDCWFLSKLGRFRWDQHQSLKKTLLSGLYWYYNTSMLGSSSGFGLAIVLTGLVNLLYPRIIAWFIFYATSKWEYAPLPIRFFTRSRHKVCSEWRLREVLHSLPHASNSCTTIVPATQNSLTAGTTVV
jgi:hypothetical protein